jgi:alkylresorcinol/alkylpyrone synthase
VARILGLATALPAYPLEASEALRELRAVWPRLERLDADEAALGVRYTCEPVESLLKARTLDELQRDYLANARRLAASAATGALASADVTPSDIDLVVSVSCTGYLVPSLDVHLAGELGLRRDVLRLPITELGCSGGAAALAFAARHIRAFPDHKILVVAVEVPSLSFHADDASVDNLTAALVFGDGAGAAVLGGSRGPRGGLELLRAASYLIPATADLLGFDLGDRGFRVVLDRRLPRVIEAELPAAAKRFLGAADARGLDFIAAHAAGPRIFEAIERALRLPRHALQLSRDVFHAVGNTSSAAIFFTLERVIQACGPTPARGLGLGLGPGVSIELMELAWVPSEDARDEALLAGERLAVSG